jgi:hypothetical protein
MPDRDFELDQLLENERHINQARQRIAEQESRISKLSREGHDVRLAEMTLHTLQGGLHTMYQHREIILKTIEQMDRGLL